MTAALWIALAVLAVAQIITFIMQRKRIMNLEESLAGLVEFNEETRQSVLAAVGNLPNLITGLVADTTRKVLDAYTAEHPQGGGSVSDEVILATAQALTEQSKSLRGLGASIELYFDRQKAFGDPNKDRPDEPAASEEG